MSRRRALLSVSNKDGVAELGQALAQRGWEVLSTGGTARVLREAGVAVTEVAETTGHPEMMDGRVKTLHPAIHAGLLARRSNPRDMEELEGQGYGPIDLVAVNLYPFQETVAREDVNLALAMDNVDIGGPTMIRAAAKNHGDVWVVVDPSDYRRVLEALDGEPAAGGTLKRELAAKVFQHIARYDAAVAEYLAAGLASTNGSSRGTGEGEADVAEADSSATAPDDTGPSALPSTLTLELRLEETLRYGENPDQAAAFYVPAGEKVGIAGLVQHHGKALSYNNLLDLDGALQALAPFAFSSEPAVCIVKHTTPCGLALGESVADAFIRARATDPVSSFGSVISTNRILDSDAAEAMSDLFVECVVAPGFTEEAMELLTGKKNLRILTTPEGSPVHPLEPSAGWWSGLTAAEQGSARFLAHHAQLPSPVTLRSVYGGVLVQSPPAPPFFGLDDESWKVVTQRSPSEGEARDLAFAWAAVAGVKSNAILLAKGGATVGIGAGQMSRVDSSKIAVRKAREAELGEALDGAAL
ncbi:MAG: bifunctional phosphoribosylaminoimidazolecarboxamide formyltransferase/IMP cyclohydrolase, partial [Gemmatimonadota bacterium]|nr:bifunctional phosphoribosylaminoimidazolecarboxamide formyltransferase/IMP cyclohydrolase [Gemmatimonadota bacterium]